MILQQLRCCGVLEVVRIAKAGYPTRYPHKTFVKRYIELMPRSAIKSRDTIALCEQLLAHFRVPQEMWQLGHTKIFFRAGVLGAHLHPCATYYNFCCEYQDFQHLRACGCCRSSRCCSKHQQRARTHVVACC